MDDKLTLIADLVAIEKREALKNTTKNQPLSSSKRQQELFDLILRRSSRVTKEEL